MVGLGYEELNESMCIDEFKMLAVTYVEGLEGLYGDGVVGLAPSAQRSDASVFIDELYRERIIQKKIFSMELNSLASGLSSSISLGSYSLPLIYSEENIAWNDIENPYFWSVRLVEASIGNRTIGLSTSTALIDSGTAYVIAPEEDFS